MTIIATIGHNDFALANIQDAEAMLQILARAQSVNKVWDSKNSYYSPDYASFAIEISTHPIVSEEEHATRVAEKAAAKAAVTAAEEGVAA